MHVSAAVLLSFMMWHRALLCILQAACCGTHSTGSCHPQRKFAGSGTPAVFPFTWL